MGTLVLLRHGLSDWNAKNLFTGWVDVPLSDAGEAEARRGGELLVEAGLLPDVVHTSLLRRAISTANIALDVCDRHWIPVKRNWRLNERHYGALQGKDKKQTLAEFGEEQFMLWRRSYDVPPPPIEAGSEFSQDGDPRYASLGADMPATECLADVVKRFLPYWEESVVPDVQAGKIVLLAAHGNSLRALVKHLDGISDADIAGLNIPTGIPLRYELDDQLKPVKAGGEYLDPDAAKEAAAAVANQGALSGAVRIALASDHAGYPLKEEIKALLAEHELTDFGTHSTEAADLPDHVHPAAKAVSDGEVDRAILVDGVGYGSAMIANKLPGVYAAVCQDPFCAGLARSHSDTNVLCLGGKIIGSALALEIVKVWMTTDFLADQPKYRARVDKVVKIAEMYVRRVSP